MGHKIFLDGKFVDKEDAKISVFDHGLLYGDGVFEGIRSYSRKIFRVEEHVERLYESADEIKLKVDVTQEEFIDNIVETLKVNDLDDAYIRAVITRGIGDLGLDPRKCKHHTVFIIAGKIKLYPQEYYEKGLKIVIAATRRNHPTTLDPKIKSLNYLNNILGKIDAIEAGVEEAIMLSVEGHVAECTGDNIFIVENGMLVTPVSEIGSLKGITQQAVIELAEKRGIKTMFRMMLPGDVIKGEECFLTGTAAEIIPAIKIDETVIGNGKPGEITKQLLADYRELTAREGREY